MLTTADLAKYPFTIEASEYVKGLRIGIEELASGNYDSILDRAEERIRESERDALVSPEWQDTNVEILSYPASIMLVSQLANDRIARRYALSESKRAYEHLRNENPEKMLEIAQNTFGWKTISQVEKDDTHFNCSVHFTDYLRNAKNIRDSRWKLANRLLDTGVVYVSSEETARLLEEEIQHKVYSRIRPPSDTFPKSILERIKSLRQEVDAGRYVSFTGMPKVVVSEAMPPCVKALNQMLSSKKHLSHMGRFTLTSFLLNVGVNRDDLVKMFREATDFSERLTRYQIEHIGGSKGVKTRYLPPKCETLKTHGLCVNPDNLCMRIRHPLTYYRRRVFRRRGETDER